jgi:hypothetical protein
MLPFYSGSSDFSPRAEFSNLTGLFELSGVSRPENVSAFYNQLIDWLRAFEKDSIQNGTWPEKGITVNFKLTYCNSASSKYIFQILEILLGWRKYGITPVINWYYDESDDMMRDDGQDLADALEYKFIYIPLG